MPLLSGDIQAVNYFVATKYTEALQGMASANNSKVVLMPMEASSVIGSIAGIAEIARETFGKDEDACEASAKTRRNVPPVRVKGDKKPCLENMWIWWLLIAVFMAILEIFIPSTLLIWFALGAVLAMGTALIPGLELSVQLIVFALGSLSGLAPLRPYILARRDAGEDNREVNEFDQTLVGSSGVLVDPIVGGKGRARIGDTTWTVTGPDLPQKTHPRDACRWHQNWA